MELPPMELGENPIRHAHSCLSLSAKFLRTLIDVLPASIQAKDGNTSVALSVGSGTGLLEALLLRYLQSAHPDGQVAIRVEGVEVHQTGATEPANKYLPEPSINTVRSAREVSSRLKDPGVSSLLFVYPRQPSLVSQYIQAINSPNSGVKLAVWLGPVADWEDFSPCFALRENETQSTRLYNGDEVGLGSFEMMAVWTRI